MYSNSMKAVYNYINEFPIESNQPVIYHNGQEITVKDTLVFYDNQWVSIKILLFKNGEWK